MIKLIKKLYHAQGGAQLHHLSDSILQSGGKCQYFFLIREWRKGRTVCLEECCAAPNECPDLLFDVITDILATDRSARKPPRGIFFMKICLYLAGGVIGHTVMEEYN